MEQSVNQILQFFRPEGLIPASVVLLVAWSLARVFTDAFDRLGSRFTEHRLTLQQTKAITRLGLYLGGLAAAVPLIFSLSREAILALGGTVAVAVAIALRDLVASVIAGITILVDKPFRVGDRITYGDHYGEVVEIGLRTVRIVTLDDNLVTIPNNKFLTDVVASGNAGELDMLVQMDFFIALEEDIARAKRVVAEALASSRFAYLKKPWSIVVSEVLQQDFVAVRIRAKVYVLDVRYEKALETDVTERVLEAFRAEGISGPTRLRRDVA